MFGILLSFIKLRNPRETDEFKLLIKILFIAFKLNWRMLLLFICVLFFRGLDFLDFFDFILSRGYS